MLGVSCVGIFGKMVESLINGQSVDVHIELHFDKAKRAGPDSYWQTQELGYISVQAAPKLIGKILSSCCQHGYKLEFREMKTGLVSASTVRDHGKIS